MELANNYIAILDEVGKKFGLAIDWTQQNIQPYMQELVKITIGENNQQLVSARELH